MSTDDQRNLSARGFIYWLSCHRECIRDGVWREIVWDGWMYSLKAWRCHLFGHRFDREHMEYEWAGYPVHSETWLDCTRKGCHAAKETWSVYGEPRGVIGG